MPISPTNIRPSLPVSSLRCAGRRSLRSRTAAFLAVVWMGCVLAALECSAPAGFGADSPPVVTNRIWTYVATAGSNATFHVDVSGTPPIFYQWQRNDLDVPDATNSTYAIPSVGCFDSAIFQVVISNAFGAYTNLGRLTVVGCVRALVNAAAPGDTVMLSPGVFYDTIFIDKDLIIQGAGMTNTTIDGGGPTLNSNVFVIASNVTVTLRSLTISGGFSEREPGGGVHNLGNTKIEDCQIRSNYTSQRGGGVANEGSLVVSNCVIISNSADGAGAIQNKSGSMVLWNTFVGGNVGKENGFLAIENNGTMAIIDSVIVTNRTGGPGSGSSAGPCIGNLGSLAMTNTIVQGNFSPDGGGVYNSGEITMHECTIGGNLAYFHGGGAFVNWGTAILQKCKIVGQNSGDGSPGGIFNDGFLMMNDSEVSGNRACLHFGGAHGGIYNSSSATAILNNCTVSSNLAGCSSQGSGIGNYGRMVLSNSTLSGNVAFGTGGGIWNKGTLDLFNCTLYGNSANLGGGIFNTGLVTIANSILAGNTATANEGADVLGPLNSLGYNLIQQTNDATITNLVTGNLYGVDPLLGSLKNNGGPTPTHALLPGSPAIDAGSAADFPAADQRGVARPVDGDGDGVAVSDIGAFEFVHPKFASVERADARWLRLRLFVGAPGQTCVFEAFTRFESWTAISTNQADADGWATMDVPPDQPKRFFRAVLP